MVKIMLVEWEVTLKCNFDCKYCGLRQKIEEEIDELKLDRFIQKLKTYNTEIFCFGGEPFLHPKIHFITQKLFEYDVKHVFQTNFSPYSVKCFGSLKYKPILQISIHEPYYESLKDHYIASIKTYKNYIRQISIMFLTPKALKIYDELKTIIDESKLVISAIGDFKVTGFIDSLHMFNQLSRTLNKRYNFETPIKQYGKYRLSRPLLWELIMTGKIEPTRGKPCLYKGRYILFDPQLNSYNCSYRCNSDICPHKCCFFM